MASGTSGIFYSIINVAQAGDNIVSARNLYGGTYTQFKDILPALGIKAKFVDSHDPKNFAAAIDEKTRALFCETVSNPALDVTDLEAVAKVAKEHGLPLIVDSTFSTPYLTRPLDHGADVVVHSLTKWFGGHGTGIGGVVVDSGSSRLTARPIVSLFSAMPGPLVVVMPRWPPNAAPKAAPMPAISSSACSVRTPNPLCRESSWRMSEAGVIG